MGIDVLDLLGSQPGLLEGASRRADRSHPARCRQRDVGRVGGRSVPDQLGERGGAAGLRVLELLQHEDAGALADHEAITARIEGAGRRGRVVVPCRERTHRREPADEDLEDARLRAAREHDVGVVSADGLVRLADRVAARRARGHRREIGSGHAVGDGDLPRAHVRDAHRDQERADPVGAAQGVGREPVVQRPDAAEPRPEDRPPFARRARLRAAPGAPPGPSPRARPRGRTGCSGPSGAGPCGPGRGSHRTPAPRRRSAPSAATGRTPRSS